MFSGFIKVVVISLVAVYAVNGPLVDEQHVAAYSHITPQSIGNVPSQTNSDFALSSYVGFILTPASIGNLPRG